MNENLIYLIMQADKFNEFNDEVICAFLSESKAQEYKRNTKVFKDYYLWVDAVEIKDYEVTK